MLSPIGIVMDESEWNRDGWLKIAGTESLDYMKLHKKFSFRDEPSFKLDALGKKYVGLEKIEYEGSLDRLFKEDKQKFIAYNFRDVEILKALDEKFQYLPLTKNLAHKGKINYSDVYTCGDCDPKIGCDMIIEQLFAQNHTLSYIER